MLRNFLHFVTALVITVFAMALPIATSAGTMDEMAFKKVLVENSPWSVAWENDGDGGLLSGTHKIRFMTDGTVIAGELFASSSGTRSSAMESLKFKNNTCVKFTSGASGREYSYCLQPDGTLTGDYEGMRNDGASYGGEVTATPAKR